MAEGGATPSAAGAPLLVSVGAAGASALAGSVVSAEAARRASTLGPIGVIATSNSRVRVLPERLGAEVEPLGPRRGRFGRGFRAVLGLWLRLDRNEGGPLGRELTSGAGG